jgi:hypothetical protein
MKAVKPGIVGSTGKVAFAYFIERGQRARASINRVNSHGFMRGSVVIPPDIDLTEPIATEPFAAEHRALHA